MIHIDPRIFLMCIVTKGLFKNYVISKLTYMVLQIMTQHDDTCADVTLVVPALLLHYTPILSNVNCEKPLMDNGWNATILY